MLGAPLSESKQSCHKLESIPPARPSYLVIDCSIGTKQEMVGSEMTPDDTWVCLEDSSQAFFPFTFSWN